MADQNGYHIVLKAIEKLSKDIVNLIIEKIKLRVFDISITRNGCCAIQKILEDINLPKRGQLISKILKISSKLIWDNHAHYVLSFIISMKNNRYNSEIVKRLIKGGELEEYCKYKQSASVLDKLIDSSCIRSKKALLAYFMNKQEFLIFSLISNKSYAYSGKDYYYTL